MHSSTVKGRWAGWRRTEDSLFVRANISRTEALRFLCLPTSLQQAKADSNTSYAILRYPYTLKSFFTFLEAQKSGNNGCDVYHNLSRIVLN